MVREIICDLDDKTNEMLLKGSEPATMYYKIPTVENP